MFFVDYNSNCQFVSKIGERYDHINALDSWEGICGCYTLDLDGFYLFLYSEGNEIYLEYKEKKYPIAMCSCSYYSKENKEKFWEAHEIWKIEISDNGNLLCEIYYKGGYEDSEYETFDPNFGQYISKLNENVEFREWYLSNHSPNKFFPKIYLSRLSFVSSKISFDGKQTQIIDASCPMRDGFFEQDMDGFCSMLYVENQKLILFYKNSKFSLDDPNLTIDCEIHLDGEDRTCNLKIGAGMVLETMRYVCPSQDFWGDDEEWEYDWGSFLRKLNIEADFRKQVYDEIMFLKKR